MTAENKPGMTDEELCKYLAEKMTSVLYGPKPEPRHDIWTSFVSYCTIATLHLLLAEKSERFKREVKEHILKQWKKAHVDKLNEELNVHNDALQKPLGKLLVPMMGDGEDLRLKYMEMLKQVEDKARAALFPEEAPVDGNTPDQHQAREE